MSDADAWEDVFSTAPNAPLVLAPDNLTSNRFDARWRSCAGATNYFLDVALDAEFTDYLSGCSNAPVGPACVHALEDLVPGQTYFYRVRAGNAAGTSASSSVASGRPWPAAYATNGVPLWWLARYYTDIEDPDGLALSDTDLDGNLAWEEYVADTNPTNPASYFQQMTIGRDGDKLTFLIRETSPQRFYYLDESPRLMDPDNAFVSPPWSNIFKHQGVGEMNIEYDLPEGGKKFYRGKVGLD